MHVRQVIKHTEKTLRSNSPVIMTGFGVSGVITTAYFAGKASYEAAGIISYEERVNGYDPDHRKRFKDRTKKVWKLYIPTAISGVLTIGCIVTGAKLSSKKAAAAYSLLSVSEKAFNEYREKVVEQLGEKKEQVIRDEVAKDRVNSSAVVVVSGTGNVLCYEMHTGRYFNSDIESLRRAENEINSRMHREDYATMFDFYHMINLPSTSYSGDTGWTSDKLMELQFSTVMSPDGRPCIAFDYNYVKTL